MSWPQTQKPAAKQKKKYSASQLTPQLPSVPGLVLVAQTSVCVLGFVWIL